MTDKKDKQQSKKSQLIEKKEEETTEDIRGIVRLAGKDIYGNVKLLHALKYIRGIGYNTSKPIANILSRELGLSLDIKIGALTDEQVEKIDTILFNIHQYKLPKFLMNRRTDIFDGQDKHIIMNDLIFSTGQDIESEKKAYTWKGYRHAYSQKVRGQRTRNTGRTGMAVGVLRKAILQQQKATAVEGATGRGARAAAAPAGPKKVALTTPVAKKEEKKE